LGQKFQHKSKEFFEFGLGDVGLGLWNGTSFFVSVTNGALVIVATKTTYLSNEHSRVKGYLALTLKLLINPYGQIWAAPAKFGQKSSISTNNISTKKNDFDKRVA